MGVTLFFVGGGGVGGVLLIVPFGLGTPFQSSGKGICGPY